MRPLVMVTGAAGAIGSATARIFRDAGYGVVCLDRDPAVFGMDGEGMSPRVVDVSDERELDEAVGSVRRLGALHHVVGVAGGAMPEEPRAVEDPLLLSPAVFRRTLEANLVSQFLVVRAVLPWLRESPGVDRSISLTSSFNGLAGYGMPGYSAAKAGLAGMMYGLVTPLGREGIRVNVVAPGTIPTPRTERIWSHVDGHFDRLAQQSALGRLGRPEDVARVFLAVSTLMTHVTGQVLVVDGGQMAWRSSARLPDSAPGAAPLEALEVLT